MKDLKFKIGQRVKCIYNGNAFGTPVAKIKGQLATVISIPYEGSVCVKWDDPKIGDYFQRQHGTAGGHWGWVDWEVAEIPLPAEKLVKFKTRDGRPASTIRHVGGERPFKAYIEFGKRRLDLSFDQYGRFYPSVDSPFDLVCK